MSTLHDVPVPLQSPLQLLKVDPVEGVAVRPTVAPPAKVVLHPLPGAFPAEREQLIPEGLLEMTPDPAPAPLTLSVVLGTGASGGHAPAKEVRMPHATASVRARPEVRARRSSSLRGGETDGRRLIGRDSCLGARKARAPEQFYRDR